MTRALDDIRAEIDTLDADLRRLLLARGELVKQVAAAKTSASASPLRPMREMQQMLSLINWQKHEAQSLSAAGLIAIWREIIGMALAQQGGVTIFASPAAMPVARTHFGASLDYVSSEKALAQAAGDTRGLAVLSLAEAVQPEEGQAVMARLPVLGAAAALVYGSVSDVDEEAMADNAVALVSRKTAQDVDKVIYQAADYLLVETHKPGDDAVWGRYLTFAETHEETHEETHGDGK